MMQYDVDSPEQYLNALEDDWRKQTLLEIRDLIFKQSNEFKEGINYKMLCYSLGENSVFHLNAQKGYVSLYSGGIDKIDPNGKLLNGLNVGKSCIRFSKTKKVSNTRINEFIAKAIELSKQGHNFEC